MAGVLFVSVHVHVLLLHSCPCSEASSLGRRKIVLGAQKFHSSLHRSRFVTRLASPYILTMLLMMTSFLTTSYSSKFPCSQHSVIFRTVLILAFNQICRYTGRIPRHQAALEVQLRNECLCISGILRCTRIEVRL
jgi:hypothetical protein